MRSKSQMIIQSLLVFTVQRNQQGFARVIQAGLQQKSLNSSVMISFNQSLRDTSDSISKTITAMVPSAWAYTYAKDGKLCASTSKTLLIFHTSRSPPAKTAVRRVWIWSRFASETMSMRSRIIPGVMLAQPRFSSSRTPPRIPGRKLGV